MLTTDPPTITPERGAYLRAHLGATAAALLRMMLADLAAPGSTATLSPTERMMLATLRPWLPKVEAAILGRIASADPAMIERVAGATADYLAALVYYAPGDPLPRYAWASDGAGGLVLVPAPEADA